MSKPNWKDTWQYKRIVEILEDYWLSEPEEYVVHVKLYFLKADGQHQEKSIIWVNPNYEVISEDTDDGVVSMEEILERDESDFPLLKDMENIRNGKVKRI